MRLLVSLLGIVLTSFALPSFAQDCAEPFVFFYGENADYGARTLLAQDSFLFVGGFRDEAALVAKLTLTGEVIWVQTMQPYPNLPNAIVDLKIDSEGALIGVGQARQDATIESFAFKLNPADGATSWTQTYADPATGYYAAADIHEPVAGGNYVLLGTALNTNDPSLGCDATFYSLNRNTGNIASERIHYHLGSCESIEAAIVRNGNFYVTGRYNFAGGGLDKMRAAVSSFNSTGTAIWSRLYLVNVLQNARMYSSDISQDGPNNLVVLAHGDDNGTLTDNNDIWLFRTNLAGGAQWALKYTFPEAVSSQEVLVVENGYVLVASANAGTRTYLTRVNGAGTVIWAKYIDGLLAQGTGDEIVLLGGSLYLAAQRLNGVNNQVALLRLDVETGELPGACLPSVAVQLSQQIDSAPYDGFNALSLYNTQVAGAGSFAVAAAELAPLPTSCAPDCGAEICENGIDDDNDGLVDCDDPDCNCESDCDQANFVSVFGTPEEEENGYSLLALANGNILLGGGGTGYISLMEVSPEGTLVGEKRIDIGTALGTVTDLALDSDGKVIGAGRIGSNVGVAFRYDLSSNNLLWFNQTPTQRTSYAILEPIAGGDFIYMGDRLQSPFPGNGDDAAWISLDRNTGLPTGTISANYELGGPESFYQSLTYNGKIYHSGRMGTSNSPDKFRASVSRFSLDGQEEWTRLLHVPTNENARLYGYDVDVDDNALIVTACGDDNGSSLTESQVFLYKLSLDGQLIWVRKYDIPEFNNEWAHELVVLPDGFLILGQELNGNAGIFLLKVDKQGEVIWTKRYLAEGQETFSVAPTEQMIKAGNSIYFTGSTQRFSTNNSNDILLVRTTLDGLISGDCYSYQELDVTAVTVSDAVATPVSLLNYAGSLNFTSSSPAVTTANTPQLGACVTPCTEECGNGIDDDNDGLVDCDDPDLANDCCCYVPPVLDLPNDTTLCNGATYLLNAGEGYSSYRWSDLSTAATLTVTAAGTYAVSVSDRCGTMQTDSVAISFSQQPGSFSTAVLCPGRSLAFGNQTITAAGLYVDTTSVGPCLQVDSLQVTLAEPVTTTVMAGFCPGGSVDVAGVFFSEAGTYTTILVGANGCDSTHVIIVTELTVVNTSAEATICAGETIDLFGEAVSQPGVYSGTFTGSNGCDSVHTIALSVLEATDTEAQITICRTGSTEVFGTTVTEAGVYSRVFTGANGCDSTHTITVVVTPSILTSENIVLCAGETVEVFGEIVGEASIYSTLLAAANGCDSTHTIFVDVLDPVTTLETIQICPGGSALIFGNSESLPGAYSQTLTGSNGCDSTHTVLLEVLESPTTSETITICAGASILLFGTPTSTAGDYSMTFVGSNGCDSVHTVTLVVNPPVATNELRTLCAGTTTEVFGQAVGERGDYSMTFTTAAGCDSIHTISVVVLAPIATSETLTGLCSGTSVEVFGQPVTEAGQYQQTFTAAQGCDSTHTVVVNFLPPNDTRDTLTICPGESVEVFGVTVTEPGSYQSTSTAANGCDSTHTVLLQNETFVGSANIFPPCPSDPDRWIVYIRTRGNGGPYVVTWNGQTIFGNTINGVPPGDHIAQVTSANGCVYEVPFTVRPYNRPWTALAMAPDCNNPQSGAIRLEVAPTDETLSFSLDGEHFSTEPLLAGLSAGTYKLYVNYGARCTVTDTITVPGAASFVVELPADQVIPWGASLPIEPQTTAGPGATFRWTPAATLDCATCEKVVAKPLETTRYRLSVTNAAGCSAEDEMLVRVERKSHYFVPNAFSPNGDGHNDYFTLFAEAAVAEITYLAVYDRWGEQVFVRTNFLPNDEKLGWNGQIKGQPAAPGTYIYYAELQLVTGEYVQVKGDVTLLR